MSKLFFKKHTLDATSKPSYTIATNITKGRQTRRPFTFFGGHATWLTASPPTNTTATAA